MIIYNFKSVFLFYLMVGLTFTGKVKAQTVASNNLDERIKKVESNLAGWVVINGDSAWTLEERMKHYGINGLSIAVVNDFKIDWAKAYGFADVEEKRFVTTSTLFQAASISKSINTTGILKLYEDGKLDIYKDINEYLFGWKFPYDSKANGKTINLSNLLCHTAGLTIHGFDGYVKEKPLPSVEQILDGKKPANSKAVRSAYEPGVKFDYSGGGITISQLIVTNVSNTSYENFMQTNVLKPMGMNNSSFIQPPSGEMQKNIATGYNSANKMVKGKFHVYPELAAAGLWTTPTDLCKYIIETELALKGKSNKVLSQKTTELRVKSFKDTIEPDCDLIMGGFLLKGKNESYFFHAGGNEGFTALYFGSLNSGNGVAIMCNGSFTILKEIANSVAKAYNWTDFPLAPIYKTTIQLSDDLKNKYVGKYKFNGQKCAIEKKNNELYVKYDGDLLKLYFTSSNEFFVLEQRKKDFKIVLDSNAKITGDVITK